MIVLDPEDHQQVKTGSQAPGPTVRPPDRVTVAARASSSILLPDYETSEALHRNHPYRKPTLNSKLDSRLWKSTLYALAIYVALSIVIGVPLVVTKARKHKGMPINYASSLAATSSDQFGGDVFALDEDYLGVCTSYEVAGSADLLSSTFSHTLKPTNSLRIRSNASSDAADAFGISGIFDLDINPDKSQTDVAITVFVNASNSQLRSDTHVCFIEDGADKGVVIYVPSNVSEPDFLSLSISVLLPQTATPISLASLETTLPFVTQHVSNFSKSAIVDSVKLEGFHDAITCDGLSARQITVKNSLGGISGRYNATHEVNLDTVEGPISADITLTHIPHQEGPSKVHADTGNSGIDANVTLVSQCTRKPWHPHLPDFVGSFRTFNGLLNVNVKHGNSTPSTPLDFRIQNNQGAATVSTDGKFTGLFSAQTKLANVDVRKGVEDSNLDPHGQGRERRVFFDQNSLDRSSGWIGWGMPPAFYNPHRHGRLEVISSLEPVLLRLGPESS